MVLSSGALSLPQAITARAYSSMYYTTALIYEFERGADGEGAAYLKIPSELQGKRPFQGLVSAALGAFFVNKK
ncbi:MAG: hypothetical protein ACREV4_13405 [Gammaproteobacteria bacterium]